jgi:hypothetical protein
MKTLLPLIISAFLTLQPAFGVVVTFQPILDADQQTNTSGTTPYGANNTDGGLAPAGIPNNTQTSYTDTYFFADTVTGIGFSLDVRWVANGGGNLNPNNNILGVGDSDIQIGESITVTVDNLVVDTSSYNPGSIAGLPSWNVEVDTFALGFHSLNHGSFNQNDDGTPADDTIFSVTDGVTTFTGTDNNGTFVFNSEGFSFPSLGDTSDTFTYSLGAGSPDPTIRLSAQRFRVQLDVVSVPEPSGTLLLLAGACGTLFLRRRCRD